jgi:ATP-dependent DNA ligase
LEGVVAKRLDSRYEPGSRSGAWRKMRIDQGQEFVIGGYTLGGKNFDAVIFGCYEGGQLLYVGRTRNRFTPSSREQLFRRFRGLETTECPIRQPPGGQKRTLGAGSDR